MGVAYDDIVGIRPGQNPGDPTVISISCNDQLGLGCDITRILLEFGLCVVKGDLTTDGEWCFVIFWVTPRDELRQPIKWSILKKRLISACPSTRAQLLLPVLALPKPKEEVFILQACSLDRTGLLYDVAQVLWEHELTIQKMKGIVRPDGKVLNLLYLTDSRPGLHEKRRQDSVRDRLRDTLGSDSSCEINLAGPEWKGLEFLPESSLPPSVLEDLFLEPPMQSEAVQRKSTFAQVASARLDNLLSPVLSLLQISCKDRKGLLYDCLRTLKDFQIQVAYGRLLTKSKGLGDLDLFISQGVGKKIVDPEKQKLLCCRLESEILHPLRIKVVTKGPDAELLVGSPTEDNGRGRPRVLHDIALTLKYLKVSIFKADMGRYTINGKKWEVYQCLLTDTPELALSSNEIKERITDEVTNMLLV